jgi:prepilin-type processing-associated H-X9-DG protein
MTFQDQFTATGPQLAFSRSDLLACVSLVTVLFTIAILTRARIQAAGRAQLCQGNLQQIDRAVLQFASEHNSRLPGTLLSDAGEPWWWYKDQIKEYIRPATTSSDDDRVFACSMDRGYSDPGPFYKNSRFNYTSYVFNGVALAGAPNIAGWKLSEIVQPDRTLSVMEWSAHAPLSWHRSRTGKANAPFYSDAESIVAFVDGHAERVKIYYDGYNAAYTRDPIAGYKYRYSGK